MPQKKIKNIILVVLLLLTFDALVSFWGESYLSENIGAFLGKSRTIIFSDLLFLEGSITLTVGIFVVVIVEWRKTNPLSETSKETVPNTEELPKKWMSIGLLIIFVGAVLIMLSVAAGSLLH